MPLHVRQTPERIKGLISALAGLSKKIDESMDGVRLPGRKSKDVRWQISSSSLYVAQQHSDNLGMLVARHSNGGAGLQLRALFEAYVRLAYMLSVKDYSRIAAVLYVDVIRYERHCKEVQKADNEDSAEYPEEYAEHIARFRENIQKHIDEAKATKQQNRNQLEKLNPEEFLHEKGDLLSGDNLEKRLSIRYMCKQLDTVNSTDPSGMSFSHSYALVYGSLSEHVHASTVYLARITKRDESGNTRIGTVSEQDNEYYSVRSLVSAYLYLLGTFILVLKEKGEGTAKIRKLRKEYEAKISSYANYLAE